MQRSRSTAFKKLEIGESLLRIYAGEIQLQKPQPWPAILLTMKLLAKEGDRGAGDIIARVIGPIGGDAFKLWYKAMFGKDCGCGNRQEALNRRWPL